MHRFISPTGQLVKTKTLKEFTTLSGMKMNCARSLSCGKRSSNHGWLSTHPKARKQRERFFTVLVNTITGERAILGRSIRDFTKKHGLCWSELCKLVNCRKIIYRGWVLERTLKLADRDVVVAASHF